MLTAAAGFSAARPYARQGVAFRVGRLRIAGFAASGGDDVPGVQERGVAASGGDDVPGVQECGVAASDEASPTILLFAQMKPDPPP